MSTNTGVNNTPKSASVIRAHCVVAAIMHKLPHWHYKLLTEWLDCYQYVPPASRNLKCIPIVPIHRAIDVIKMHNLCDILETTMTPSEQVIFANYIGKGHVLI